MSNVDRVVSPIKYHSMHHCFLFFLHNKKIRATKAMLIFFYCEKIKKQLQFIRLFMHETTLVRPLVFYLFLIFLSVPNGLSAGTQDSVAVSQVSPWDEGAVNYRHPPYQQIEAWQSNPRYDYDRDQGPGFWNYLLSRGLSWLFSSVGDRSWVFYLFLAIGGLFILYVILRILDIPVAGLLVLSRPHEHSGLQFGDDEQDYSSEKLIEMFRMFRDNGAYREAVRMMFLLYLRELHERGLIVVRRFKTNYDYFREIDLPPEKEVFRKRMKLFDIVWYGHADISALQFKEVEKAFTNVMKRRGIS